MSKVPQEGDSALKSSPEPSNHEELKDGERKVIAESGEKEEVMNEISDNSDSDSDDEAQQNLQLQSLEAGLTANPYNYDSHSQYIKLLRKMGDVEKLRAAREAMSELFPLSPAMWQEWIKDELSLNTDSQDSSSVIVKLYERAVFDYMSVSLWCDYINFVQEFDPIVRQCSPAGISKARDLFEGALTAAGLHVAEGSKIWEAYRQYEQAILLTIDETDTQAKEKQVQRIRGLFHRQLSVPLADMSSTFTDYKTWEEEQGSVQDPNVVSAYQKALEMYNARGHFEEHVTRLDSPDSERLQHYLSYLKFEETSGTPARVQVLYERAITDFPISPDLWLGYTRYMDKTLKVGSVVSNIYFRATKNCPWVGELWVRYMLSMERSHASEKELAEVFEKSLRCTFSTLDEYLDLFLTRIDGLRRRMASTGEEDQLEYTKIREVFQQASDYLSPQLKNTEGLLHLHAYWARLEAKLGKDIIVARGVWENFLKICGSMLEAWKSYIAMEVELGHINEARSIYRRCYSKRFSGTGSEDICRSWLRFEREFGKLEDFDHALQKVTPRLEQLRLFRMQQESNSIEENENSRRKNAHDKRKLGSDISKEQTPAKRPRGVDRVAEKTHVENKHHGQNSSQETKLEDVNSRNNKSDDNLPPKESKTYSDQCTAFISNLHVKANYEHVRNFFSDVGGVVAIRILNDNFTGKSRGLAYVDFLDDEHLAAGLAKNKQKLLGKRLSILRSDPKRGKMKSSAPKSLKEHADAPDHSSRKGSMSKETGDTSKVSDVKDEGISSRKPRKNTFAMPRNVKLHGVAANRSKTEEDDDKPKSNDEFRKMFIH
ncbi:uncharacterized protein LOC130960918 [Arachis stenosperma]|uniref:uncharacterized protein LOC130960918 n=1 Tax=Arachis stenosperma TaxID=217475 RepID=UPI0025AB93C8|nr:uncharacterized protein LOC130960918 [Arachis stenosperma]XP_057742436.1 uncharacterized protein LOC130960918 [Arachis stenosperma]XP_057742437.1 uncharacterized protein LOC130960918 [Arachis stenosperma]XP_057742438.1 uncharacterized protein LOC130960918 [Arachis stenosperma]XP_057742439.1 uncharacterized protein LOC130960918 [Arachis stenosperma]